MVFSPRPRDSLVPAQVERGYWGVHYDPANIDAYYSDEYGGTQDMKCGGGSGARANDGGKGGGMGGGFARAHCLEVQGVQGKYVWKLNSSGFLCVLGVSEEVEENIREEELGHCGEAPPEHG